MDMNEAVASAISAERSIAKMTVRALSEAAGIPERSLMRVLQAERDIKVNQIADLAQALGIYPHELLEHAEQILARSRRSRPALIALSEADYTLAARDDDDDAESEAQQEEA